LYGHFDAIVSLETALVNCNSIVEWIGGHTNKIFVPSPAVWPLKS